VYILVIELCQFCLEVVDRIFTLISRLFALNNLIVLIRRNQDNSLEVMRNSSPDTLEILHILFVADRLFERRLVCKDCRLIIIYAEELYPLFTFFLCNDHAIVIWTDGALLFI
jgi:hypothetical protein